jgi:hypothetical protein
MSEWQEENDRASMEGIVRHLRAAVSLDETFDVRVMSAVHAEALARVDDLHTEQRSTRARNARGWNRRFTLTFTALGGMGMAASFIGAVFLGATLLSRELGVPGKAAVSSVAAEQPAQNVHFVLVNGSAKQVWLVGDFNGWSRTGTPLVRASNGNAWAVSVPLTPGRHEYAFIVADSAGKRWMADPLMPAREDEFGTESSIVRVASTRGTEEAIGL